VKNLLKAVCYCLLFLAFISCSAANAELLIVSDLTGRDASPWERTELLEDTDPHFVTENFHLKGRQTHSSIQKAFNTNQPHSRNFLLHFAPNWNKSSNKTPILLVHGAGDNAYRGFCHPYTMDMPENGKIDKTGIMQFLVKKGFSVFAVTFSHPHGCNFLQAQQLANAISRVKEVTGSAKVDVICHSKGAMPVRIYASDLASNNHEFNWITPFRKDIRNIIFVASPLKGIDTAFRYYAYNITVKMQSMAAPLGPESMLWQGMFVDNYHHNKLFPGQFQMLHNWVKDGIPFSDQSMTMDANMTRSALYNGGVSTLLVSDGIDRAIQEGGDVIRLLNEKGIDPSVTCHILAGTKQTIDKVKFLWLEIPVGEFADSSDGVLFLKSATYTKGLSARGAKIGSVKTFDTHHVGLTIIPAALNHIAEVLSERNTDKKIR